MPYLPKGLPLPITDEIDTKEWWEHCKLHELVVQRCIECGTFRYPPVTVCYNCQSFNYGWHKVSGKGKVYSYIINYHATHPALKTRVPYNVISVELVDAGNVCMIGNLIDCPDEEIRIGMDVQVCWEEITDSITIPQWMRI
jgi:uncharacterized protein